MSRTTHRKKSAIVPPADWRVAVMHAPTLSRAGRFISRRFGHHPHTAEVIAHLAGLGEREMRQ
ncbi:hypothetical protein [Bradyrhizobium sp. STM 3561]|uniref:hypothetical protein n=1 Tax=Bradyrhizobium sp. STM 3561 TaxID=578923 RepID=UPI003890297D